MRDFEKNTNNEVLIIEVDLFRASLTDANKFRIILDKEMENGFRNIIIDLSKCTFIDSSFIGALVVTLKKLEKIGGELKLIITTKIIQNAVHLSKTVEIFKTYFTIDEALNDKSSSEINMDVKTEKFSSVA
ncbi:MAG: STAS domain-containing protein [Ignavibacterium sp.]|nr:MAG: STAS domain-containing protein [Ignavibacterium sp.]